MNWYKRCSLYNEIRRFGPKDIEDDFWKKTDEEIRKIYPDITDEEIKYMKENTNAYSELKRRNFFTKNYSWAVPTENSIKEIKDFAENELILEIGSGLGLWAKLLRDIGANVIATNIPFKKDIGYLEKDKPPYTKVEEMDHIEAIKNYINADILMLGWPPYEEPLAYESLLNFKGNKLIFIGEPEGGCTGCKKFFELLNKNWKLYKDVDLKKWMGIGDRLYMYIRK